MKKALNLFVEEQKLLRFIDNILKDYLKITYKYEKSQTTNSYYFKFFLNDSSVSLRISDHYSKSNEINLPSIIIKKSTKTSTLENSIKRRLKTLQYKAVLNTITKGDFIGKE